MHYVFYFLLKASTIISFIWEERRPGRRGGEQPSESQGLSVVDLYLQPNYSDSHLVHSESYFPKLILPFVNTVTTVTKTITERI